MMKFFQRKAPTTALTPAVELPRLPDLNINIVKRFASSDWKLGEIHGLSHWQRVERNGIILSLEKLNGTFCIRKDINITVVRLFAYLHDKCRLDDGWDFEHGIRAAKMLHSIRRTLLKELSDNEFSLLEKACELHTTEHKTGEPTIDTCFDADRLDLNRVGIEPSPNKMATEQGAYYAEYPHKLEQIKSLLF
ncbi:hypothetical protein [uncultured Bacteroides sp.]|uniref:hypothetical protein n=1 Tax=uncultured Bacteroides sp. TaxID=162156 RepID=UPI0025922040|nr:hypothetical protein [uncultured Bacteroides sp.]